MVSGKFVMVGSVRINEVVGYANLPLPTYHLPLTTYHSPSTTVYIFPAQSSQVSKTEDPRIVSVGEVKVQCVAPYDRGVLERNVGRDLRVVEHLLAGPLVDASRARAGTPKVKRVVAGLGVVRPLYRDLRVAFFDYLDGF